MDAPNDNTDAVLAQLRAKWQGEHGGAPTRLSRADVFEIVWRLVQAKVQPTVEHVRAVNGAGSPNLIHPSVRTFFQSGELQRRWEAPAPLPEVPDALTALWAEAVKLADHGAEERLAARAAELAKTAQTLAADQAELDRREVALADRERALASEMQLLRETADREAAAATAARADAALSREQRDTAQKELDTMRERAQTLALEVVRIPELEAALATERAGHQQAQERTNDLLGKLKDSSRLVDQLHAQVDRELANVEKAKTEMHRATFEAAELELKLERETALHAATSTQLIERETRLAASNASLLEAREGWATALADQAELRARCTAQQDALERLSAQLAAIGRVEELVRKVQRALVPESGGASPA